MLTGRRVFPSWFGIASSTIVLALLLASCANTPDETTGLGPLAQPALDIRATTSVDGFVFLPPIGTNPRARTDFDGSLPVVVEVCTGEPCMTHASFSVTAGTVTVDLVNEQYVTAWRPRATGAVVGATYVVRVLVGSEELGSASILVTGSGKWKLTSPPGVLAVTQESTLPIKFHI